MKDKKNMMQGAMKGSFLPQKAPTGYVDGGSLTNLHIPKPAGFGKSMKLHLIKEEK